MSMENIQFHCLAKVLNDEDRRVFRSITGFDFVNFDGKYDTIPNETIQAVYDKMSEGELNSLFEKYGVLGLRPYDGKHEIADGIMPESNVQLRIQCRESVGGAAALGKDGKWYWTFDMRLDIECEFTVTHWEYL